MKIVTFGEIMLRLSPPGCGLLVQSDRLEAFYGGAEANVAVALANWGEESCFVGKVPAHAMGQAAVNALRRWGVRTQFVLRGGERLGIYFAERGIDRRPDKVIYDRVASAFACSAPEEYDWDAVFSDADAFHFTGIVPAIGECALQIVRDACSAAKRHGVFVSCDVNYRSALWEEACAAQTLETLFPDIDLCISNEHQAHALFGVAGEDAMQALAERYGFSHVAFTRRRTRNARYNAISGALYSEGTIVRSREYEVEMAERIGGGDAFAAGLLYALMHAFPPQEAVEFAEAACCLKHSVCGDACLCPLEDVLSLARGQNTDGIRR